VKKAILKVSLHGAQSPVSDPGKTMAMFFTFPHRYPTFGGPGILSLNYELNIFFDILCNKDKINIRQKVKLHEESCSSNLK
jgi:hypothetical protein